MKSDLPFSPTEPGHPNQCCSTRVNRGPRAPASGATRVARLLYPRIRSAPVAQWIEQPPPKRKVASSTLAWGTAARWPVRSSSAAPRVVVSDQGCAPRDQARAPGDSDRRVVGAGSDLYQRWQQVGIAAPRRIRSCPDSFSRLRRLLRAGKPVPSSSTSVRTPTGAAMLRNRLWTVPFDLTVAPSSCGSVVVAACTDTDIATAPRLGARPAAAQTHAGGR